MDFDRLVEATAPARAHPVITHGEPHPANVMSADGRLILIDWDTVALAPPERDVALVVSASDEGIDRYQQATGRELNPAVICSTACAGTSMMLAARSACSVTRIATRRTPDGRGMAWAVT